MFTSSWAQTCVFNRWLGRDLLYPCLKKITVVQRCCDKLYFNIETLMTKFISEPNIINMDNSITFVQTRCPKVYGGTVVKKVGSTISTEEGRTINVVFAMSVAKNYIPSTLIFPRK